MWGVAVAMPYIFVVNVKREWYNQGPVDKLPFPDPILYTIL